MLLSTPIGWLQIRLLDPGPGAQGPGGGGVPPPWYGHPFQKVQAIKFFDFLKENKGKAPEGLAKHSWAGVCSNAAQLNAALQCRVESIQ